MNECLQQQVSLIIRANRDFSAAWNANGTLDYRGIYTELTQLSPGIPGQYQSGNAALALAAAEVLGTLGISVPETALRSGISSARWPGRMELVPGNPPLLLDGAHNPAGALALAASLAGYRYRRLLLVLGTMSDKDVGGIFSALAPLAASCYCVSPAIERAMDDVRLAAAMNDLGVASRACGSVADGIASAQRDAGPEDLILVCGSLFTVGEAKACLESTEFNGIRG
jgi:dihydrofolate synthase/folylpolyglutamate synthase